MVNLSEIMDIPPYSLDSGEKESLYMTAMRELCLHHRDSCAEYRRILEVELFNPDTLSGVEDIPFLPVRLFKDFSLKSISDAEITKTMSSSGTTGQQVSKIYLDKITSSAQTKVLSKIMRSLLGEKRLPMLVIDAASTVKDRRSFSARGAGILGFSMYGRDVTYALNDDMSLNMDAVAGFCEKYKGEPVFLFGFTFMIWQHFVQPLLKSPLQLPHGILLHGGGWKKLADSAVDNKAFREGIRLATGITRVHDYYGMVEQTGSIFIECEHGHLHASVYSDIIIRDYRDFAPADIGQRGLIQSLSLIPWSYPGHSILTEDEGTVLGVDDCPCGRLGKYFVVHGRIKNAELRGCSDTAST